MLIMDLSALVGSSVNVGIARELPSLHYTTLDNAVANMIDLSQGTLLTKMDIRQAYQNVLAPMIFLP